MIALLGLLTLFPPSPPGGRASQRGRHARPNRPALIARLRGAISLVRLCRRRCFYYVPTSPSVNSDGEGAARRMPGHCRRQARWRPHRRQTTRLGQLWHTCRQERPLECLSSPGLHPAEFQGEFPRTTRFQGPVNVEHERRPFASTRHSRSGARQAGHGNKRCFRGSDLLARPRPTPGQRGEPRPLRADIRVPLPAGWSSLGLAADD